MTSIVNRKQQLREAFEYSAWKLEKVGTSKGVNVTIYSNDKIKNSFLEEVKKEYPSIYRKVKEGIDTGNILIGYKGKGFIKLAKEIFHSSFKSAVSTAFHDTEDNKIVLLLDKNVNIFGKLIIKNIVQNVVHELVHYLATNKPTAFFSTHISDLVLFFKEFIKRDFSEYDVDIEDNDIKPLIKILLSFDEDPGQKAYTELWAKFLTSLGFDEKIAYDRAYLYINTFRKLFITHSRNLNSEEKDLLHTIDSVYKDIFKLSPRTGTYIVYSQEFIDPDEIIAVLSADSLKSKTERLIKTIKFKDHSLKSK